VPGAPDSKFCGYFGGAEVQHLASPTYQWPALLFTDVVVLTGPVVEHPDLWRAGTVVNLATSYLNLALGAAGAPFKLPKKRWGTADYRDVQSILEELMGTGHELSAQAAVAALGRFARPLANEQVTRAEVKHLKVSGMHLAYGQARVRLCIGDDHLDWLFARHLYDRVLGITQAAFGSRVQAAGVDHAEEASPAPTLAVTDTAEQGPSAG
jgi:hypothetical protein